MIYFLNTFGSIYSVSLNDYKINWFLNVNSSSSQYLSSLFGAHTIKISNQRLIISTNTELIVLDSISGSYLFKIPIISTVQPIVNNDYIFLVTKDNFLVSIDLNSGEIIYSFEIDNKISKFLNKKK